MIFVDASAFVAMLGLEEPGARVARVLDGRGPFISSNIAIWETVVALARIGSLTVAEANARVRQLLADARITLVVQTEADLEAALDAFDRFGKGRHPARLNMGDCFAYAMAKTRKAAMLAVGEDFGQTDIAMVAY